MSHDCSPACGSVCDYVLNTGVVDISSPGSLPTQDHNSWVPRLAADFLLAGSRLALFLSCRWRRDLCSLICQVFANSLTYGRESLMTTGLLTLGLLLMSGEARLLLKVFLSSPEPWSRQRGRPPPSLVLKSDATEMDSHTVRLSLSRCRVQLHPDSQQESCSHHRNRMPTIPAPASSLVLPLALLPRACVPSPAFCLPKRHGRCHRVCCLCTLALSQLYLPAFSTIQPQSRDCLLAPCGYRLRAGKELGLDSMGTLE